MTFYAEDINMNKLKKTLSVLIAAVLLFSLCLPVFAAGQTEEKPFENSEYFDYNGLTVHYRVFKAENEKAKIFMIHGFALSSYCWEELAGRLTAEGYTCVAADLPDFGYSYRENSETPLYPREDIMHALMTSLSDGRWYVAGHSMGGYIALAIAEKYPESVENLLLYGTACNTGTPDALKYLMTDKTFIPVMGRFMERLAGIDCVVRALLSVGLCDKTYAENYDLSKITAPLRIKGTGAGAIYSFSMLPVTHLDKVENMPPILYVNGSRDAVIPDYSRRLLRKHLPSGSVDVTVKNGGHMFIENLADETAKISLDFIEKTA